VTLGDPAVEVDVRGGEQPRVDADRALGADGEHLALLQHAEQRRLRGRGQVADLVEEERPAIGGAHQAVAIGGRSGEGAAAVAEQLSLDEAGRERGAVDRDQRAAAPRAVVDRARDPLLAGAGLAADLDGEGGIRDRREPRQIRLQPGMEREQARRGRLVRREPAVGGAPVRRRQPLVEEEGVAQLEQRAVAEQRPLERRPVEEGAVLRALVDRQPAPAGPLQPRMLRRHPRIGHAHRDPLPSRPLASLDVERLAATEHDLVRAVERKPQRGSARSIAAEHEEQPLVRARIAALARLLLRQRRRRRRHATPTRERPCSGAVHA